MPAGRGDQPPAPPELPSRRKRPESLPQPESQLNMDRDLLVLGGGVPQSLSQQDHVAAPKSQAGLGRGPGGPGAPPPPAPRAPSLAPTPGAAGRPSAPPGPPGWFLCIRKRISWNSSRPFVPRVLVPGLWAPQSLGGDTAAGGLQGRPLLLRQRRPRFAQNPGPATRLLPTPLALKGEPPSHPPGARSLGAWAADHPPTPCFPRPLRVSLRPSFQRTRPGPGPRSPAGSSARDHLQGPAAAGGPFRRRAGLHVRSEEKRRPWLAGHAGDGEGRGLC